MGKRHKRHRVAGKVLEFPGAVPGAEHILYLKDAAGLPYWCDSCHAYFKAFLLRRDGRTYPSCPKCFWRSVDKKRVTPARLDPEVREERRVAEEIRADAARTMFGDEAVLTPEGIVVECAMKHCSAIATDTCAVCEEDMCRGHMSPRIPNLCLEDEECIAQFLRKDIHELTPNDIEALNEEVKEAKGVIHTVDFDA